MRKVGGKPPEVEAKGRDMRVVRVLFPIREPTRWDTVPVVERTGGAEPPALFTLAELTEVPKRLPSGKALGPDRVSNKVLRALVKRDSESILRFFQLMSTGKQFPNVLEGGKAHKGSGNPVIAFRSYHPLCMLDNISKLLERLLLARLSMAVVANRTLPDSQ